MELCPQCRTTIRHTDTTGCCSQCHRVFVGRNAFETHQRVDSDAGRMICRDPATATNKKGVPAFESVVRDGFTAWRRRTTGINPWAAERATP